MTTTSPSEKAITEALVEAARKVIWGKDSSHLSGDELIRAALTAALSVPAPGAGEALPDNLDYQIRQIIDAALDSASPEPWEVSQDATKRIMSIILSALSTVTPVGEGWQTVPKEPTEAMLATQGKSRPDLAKTEAARRMAESLNAEMRRMAGDIWSEMLAASLISGSKP